MQGIGRYALERWTTLGLLNINLLSCGVLSAHFGPASAQGTRRRERLVRGKVTSGSTGTVMPTQLTFNRHVEGPRGQLEVVEVLMALVSDSFEHAPVGDLRLSTKVAREWKIPSGFSILLSCRTLAAPKETQIQDFPMTHLSADPVRGRGRAAQGSKWCMVPQ